MAKKKNFTPQEQQRIKKRIEFVQANPQLDPAEARKRFFVQTRVGELTAAGKEVDRKALRQQFTSGNVKRKGFYTEGDLQRIAASKAATKKTTSGTTGGDSTKKVNIPGPNVRAGVGKRAVGGASQPQSLADYKADRIQIGPVTLNQSSADELAYMKDKGFYKTALGNIKPDGSMTPAAKFFHKVGEVTVGAVESAKASWINPLLNTANQFQASLADFKKNPSLKTLWSGGEQREQVKANPKYRKAGTVENILNASIALPPGAGRAAAEGISSQLSKAGFARQSARIDALLKVTGGTERAGAAFAKELQPPAPTSGRGLTPPGKSVGPKGPGKNMSSYKNLAEGRGLTYRTATKAESVEFPGLTPTPAPKSKKTSTKSTAPKATTNKVSQAKLQAAADKKIEAGLKNVETPAPAAPKPVANKAATKKAATKTETTRKTGDVVTIGESKFVAGKTESGLPSLTRVKSETPAPVAKPVAKKAASPKPSKAKMKRSFKERTQAVVNQSSSGLPKSFESQESYNTWLSKGGKEQLRNATQQQRDVFFSSNRSFVEGKGAQNAAQRAAVAKKAAQRQRIASKYRKASPAVQARYNKLVSYAETQAANRLARMRGIK